MCGNPKEALLSRSSPGSGIGAAKVSGDSGRLLIRGVSQNEPYSYQKQGALGNLQLSALRPLPSFARFRPVDRLENS